MLDFTKELCPDRPLIHPTSQTKNCRFGRYVEIGDHCVLEETEVGDYTYCFGSNDIIYTALGKFNSIATGVRINPVCICLMLLIARPALDLVLPLRAGAG